MKNPFYVPFSIDRLRSGSVSEEELFANMRIIAHRLDKELQYAQYGRSELNENRMRVLSECVDYAEKNFDVNEKPDFAWAKYVRDSYFKALRDRDFHLPNEPKQLPKIEEKEFKKLLTGRRSVRFFTEEPIPDDLLRKITVYGSYAPSNCNVQAVRFIIAKSPEVRKKLEINRFTGDMGYCTLAVVVDYRFYPDGDIDSPIHDSAAAIQNILLACHYYNVGACYISDVGVNAEEKRRALNVRNDYEKVTVFVWMGRYEFAPIAPARRKIDEILAWI